MGFFIAKRSCFVEFPHPLCVSGCVRDAQHGDRALLGIFAIHKQLFDFINVICTSVGLTFNQKILNALYDNPAMLKGKLVISGCQ